MRSRMLAMCLALSLIAAACNKEKPFNPVSPSGDPITSTSPKVIIELNQAQSREQGKYSITVKGETGPEDLIKGIFLAPGQSFGEYTWSGTWAEIWDFANDTSGTGIKVVTTVPFVPGSWDHFQFNSVPGVTFPNPRAERVEFGMKLIPGGQLDSQGRIIDTRRPLKTVDVIFNVNHVRIRTPSRSNADCKPNFSGTRITCTTMPY